jgi:Domain of unknown function (DUF4349)
MRTKHAVPARFPRTPLSLRSPRRRLLGAAAVPCLIVIIAAAVAGCSGSASSSSSPASGTFAGAAGAPANAGASAAAVAPAASSAAASSAAGSSAQNGFAASGAAAAGQGVTANYVPAGRQLIYTAQLTVRAAGVSAAISRATSIVAAAGGYVSAENASSGQGQPSQATATVTFKVPVAGYAATLAALSGGGLGTQLSLSQQAQDVTQQVADVGSRVTSDEAAIAQLRSLLKHAGDVGSLLSVQNQIDSQESDLESMLAQQNALNHETAFATVTLTLVGPQAAAKPPAKATPPPGLAGGLAGGWHALRVTVSWLLTVLGAVAPFVAVAAVIGGLIWWGRRRLGQRRHKPAA